MPVNNLDVIRVVADMSFLGVYLVQNTYHYQAITPGAIDDLVVSTSLAEKLDDAYANLVPLLSTEFTFDNILVWNVTQDRPMQTLDWPTLVGGSQSTATMPYQVAALVLFRTNRARSQGRKYLPPMVEQANAGGGVLSTAALTAVDLYGDTIITPAVAGGGTYYPCNYRYSTALVSRWTNFEVGVRFRTQRRRVAGVGE